MKRKRKCKRELSSLSRNKSGMTVGLLLIVDGDSPSERGMTNS